MALTGVLFTIAFAVDVPALAVFCSYSYVSFFSISLGPLPFVFLTEVFPTQGLRWLFFSFYSFFFFSLLIETPP